MNLNYNTDFNLTELSDAKLVEVEGGNPLAVGMAIAGLASLAAVIWYGYTH